MEKDQILTLSEVANLLNVSSETVLNLISQKEIEGIKIGNQWRFQKEDILKWKDMQKKTNIEKTAIENVVSRFLSFINTDFIKMDLQAVHRFDILAKMSHFAKENGICKKTSWLFEMLSKRESLISTGIGNGIAFLHPRKVESKKIAFSGLLLGISKIGIDFRALDKEPVNLFFLILMKSEKQYLFALSYLSQLFRDETIKERILHAPDQKTVLELLKLKFSTSMKN